MYSSSCPSKDFKSKCSTALKQRQKRPLELHRINSISPRFSKTESKGSNKLIRGFFNGELISFTWNSFNNLLPQNSSQNPASPEPCHVCQVWMAWCRKWCSIHIRNRAGTSAVGNLRLLCSLLGHWISAVLCVHLGCLKSRVTPSCRRCCYRALMINNNHSNPNTSLHQTTAVTIQRVATEQKFNVF